LTGEITSFIYFLSRCLLNIDTSSVQTQNTRLDVLFRKTIRLCELEKLEVILL